jgi:hypothetical protein
MRSSILARIPGFRKRIIPEPHVPSRGSGNEIDHDETDNSDEDYLYTVNQGHACANTIKVKVKVGGASFMMTLDTGATINVIDEQTFSKMDGLKLKQTNTKAFPYNTTGTQIRIKANCTESYS